MSKTTPYPKRLIEVDLPIKRISAHSRWEKKSVPGHIKQIHLWWARRPLSACRAVICAALWPDPAPGKDDAPCPPTFIKTAKREMLAWTSHERQQVLSDESRPRFEAARRNPKKFDDPLELRQALLDFIADFSNWDNSALPEYLATSRALTQVAHEALGGAPGTKPLVVDPFAGGGSIPVEAVRVGADTFAGDLNPVAVLLNKVALEYIPKFGQELSDEVRKWGRWVQAEAEKELAEFYPKDKDGAIPIAYLWARTIKCEGPACGAEVPLIRSFWLTKKSAQTAGFRLVVNKKQKRISIEILENPKPTELGQPTVQRGSATCPICGYTTPVASVRRQLKKKKGGADEARLFCVARIYPNKQGRYYRTATEKDLETVTLAAKRLKYLKAKHTGNLSLVPTEPTPLGGGSGAGRAFSQRNYGMDLFEDLFSTRQALSMSTFARLVCSVGKKYPDTSNRSLAEAVQTVLAINLTKLVDLSTSLGAWEPNIPTVQHLFGRQAIGMCWDFAEAVPIGTGRGSWINYLEKMADILALQAGQWCAGHAEQNDATKLPLPDDSAQVFFTDPPYYDAVPYADLSDLFYVWLKRALQGLHGDLFRKELTPKAEECIVDEVKGKDAAYFERTMGQAMANGRRILQPSGIGVLVFAHKSTAGWEAQLQAMIDAGWVITSSWPIDTENASRLRAQSSAALASSIHIVCRPRENADGSLRKDDVGDWRDVLAELPKRIHDWMPRLAEEGVVGADAIFACLGPALEVFSRYARVEKPGGETVTLKEYLVHVWAAIAKEALTLIFSGADATGFEEDARLTAMWLWTLSTNVDGGESSDEGEGDTEDEDSAGKSKKAGGYVLEYDAARKIAQGLGAHLEDLTHTIEVAGDKARLLPVSERTRYLFGKDEADAPKRRKKHDDQMSLKGIEREVEEAAEEGGWGEKTAPKAGNTVLDRVHQAMILFAAGRGEAMKRFLVEEGIGNDNRFWKLAQAFSALYPPKSDEKRWVDGVLARKKGLGF
jgi:adenine-specific DNA methylase